MSAPAAPMRCGARPRHGGLVVPWISYEHGGHAAFGSTVPARREQALLRRLCQICGQGLEERICLLVRPMDVRAGFAPEPALHPECLAYSTKQCPMLNGVAANYRRVSVAEHHPAGRPCDDPACSCPRIAPDESHDLRAGRPADDWDAWMIAPTSYLIKHDPTQPAPGTVLGLDLDVPVLRVRPVRRTPRPRIDTADADRLRAALRALGL